MSVVVRPYPNATRPRVPGWFVAVAVLEESMTTQMPQVLGSATLETMTTAQNRAVLAEAEERALRAASAHAEEAPRPDGGPDEPDDTTGSYALEARGALRRVATG